ncbi:hypothetical protein [Staphylococcus pseudintermedius]|uniref:hypothetical protein n=1 Tax=Staphylococcus pseudintermedius TaxID=283734 RepID=UPI0036F3D12A
MANVTTEQVIKYINNMPTTEYYKSLDENIVNQHIFAAQEEVNDLLIITPKLLCRRVWSLYKCCITLRQKKKVLVCCVGKVLKITALKM